MFPGYDSTAFASGWAVFAVALSLWELAWKGFGLWKAARNSHKWWFVPILVFNTLGILPIVYYFFFSGRQAKQTRQQAAAASPKPGAGRPRKKLRKR